MTLLEALISEVQSKRFGVTRARLAHFAFAEGGDNAFVSELETEELVPLLEEWCRQQRIEMGSVH